MNYYLRSVLLKLVVKSNVWKLAHSKLKRASCTFWSTLYSVCWRKYCYLLYTPHQLHHVLQHPALTQVTEYITALRTHAPIFTSSGRRVLYSVVYVVQYGAVWCIQCGASWCSMVQCAAVCCSVLQCVAVCCYVQQCVAACAGCRRVLHLHLRRSPPAVKHYTAKLLPASNHSKLRSTWVNTDSLVQVLYIHMKTRM